MIIDSLSVLLVDLDTETRKTVRNVLEKDNTLANVLECRNAIESHSIINVLNPDLVLVEVLPEVNAFILVDKIDPSLLSKVIFLISERHHAAKMFIARRLNYVLKPCEEQQLNQAIAKAKAETDKSKNPMHSRAQDPGTSEKMFLSDSRLKLILEKNELRCIEARGKYVRIALDGKSLLLRIPISTVEKMLDPSRFVRIHRSNIVNIEHIRSLKQTPYRKTYDVALKDGTILTLSRKEALQRILQNLSTGERRLQPA